MRPGDSDCKECGERRSYMDGYSRSELSALERLEEEENRDKTKEGT